MIAVFGWGIAIIELVVIFVLVRALDIAQQERDECMKWAAKREILRKFWEERG